MAKYNYDRSGLKGLGVGAFLGEVKVREAKIAAAGDEMPRSIFNANILARRLHPEQQFVKVAKVTDHGDAKSYTLVPDPARGTTEMAYFRAGQYVTIDVSIEGAHLYKPYSICSGPKDALDGSYTITVRRSKGGYVSEYILEHWAEGTEAIISGPQGDFYYMGLRDARRVVAMAGGSGITPFHSMACAVADGIEDFELTILYGNRTRESILLREELDAVAARSNGKVKIVHVLSDEEVEGYEHGFITAELIKKHAGEGDYSLFLCGPKAMYAFADTQIAALGLPRRRARKELYGDYGDPARSSAYPADAAGKTFSLTVRIRGEKQTVPCRAEQTLLIAMEQAGIKAPAGCRSGECGWCHSLLVSGKVFIPEEADGRREGDKKFGWIHPCSTYPLSDIELDVPTLS